MLQCFSGPYSALFDKSCRKKKKKPIIIPRAADWYLVAAKNTMALRVIIAKTRGESLLETCGGVVDLLNIFAKPSFSV